MGKVTFFLKYLLVPLSNPELEVSWIISPLNRVTLANFAYGNVLMDFNIHGQCLWDDSWNLKYL